MTIPDMVQVGMGVTIGAGSDCYPATVVGLSKSGRTVKVQYDSYRRIDQNGLSESQQYVYSENKSGVIIEVRMNKRGVWKVLGQKWLGVSFGHRRAYYDPSF